MTARELFYHFAGLGFLFLAKAKNKLSGYSSPKPFDLSEIERCVDYDLRVVDGWIRHLRAYLGNETPANIEGKRVLELGPGSDLGVGLYLLGMGAAEYNACDVGGLATKTPDAFYEALLSRLRDVLSVANTRQLRSDLEVAKQGVPSRLNYVVRDDFDLPKAFPGKAVDLVFSQAAFEHFDDVDTTVAGLSAIAAPGAVFVAEIDLKTHSRWIRDKDPNNIYRYSPSLYKLFQFRGAPNRLRPRDYARALERHGWTDVSVTPLTRTEVGRCSGMHRSFRDSGCEMELLTIVLCARRSEGREQTRGSA